ncbi:MAG: hypothetical protein WC718_09340 [Phycisphaerales bacterium]|jgi:hypothetical protein
MGGHADNHGHDAHDHGHGHADAWHHHDPMIEGEPQTEHLASVNPAKLAKWFVILIFSLVIFMGAVALYFNGFVNQAKSTAIETDIGSSARTMRNAAYSILGEDGNPETYDWADPQAGKVQIPIEKAKQKIIEKYGKSK